MSTNKDAMTDFETCPVGTMNEVEQLREDRDAFRASSEIRGQEIEQLRARIAELERTGRAVVARWDSPDWKDGTHTKDYIDALRAALAKDGDL